MIIIAGLKQPLAALMLSCFHFLFRLLYTLGYVGIGPNYRTPGAIANFFVTLTLMGLSLYTCSEFLRMYSVDMHIDPHIVVGKSGEILLE